MDATQIELPAGALQSLQQGGWNGMSIKEILEKVDLFNITNLVGDDDQKLKEAKASLLMPNIKEEPTKTEMPSNNSAFLGPKIWKKPLNFYKLAGRATEPVEGSSNSINTQEADFSVMNIDDFLTENNFDIGRVSPAHSEELFGSKGVHEDTPFSAEGSGGSLFSFEDMQGIDSEQPLESPPVSVQMPGSPINKFDGSLSGDDASFPQSPLYESKMKPDSPKGKNEFLYVESKRARMEREKEERMRREEARTEFSAEELALATIPGADFDPTRRQFSSDELRPQPIIRKRRKAFVDMEQKDDKYWEKRGKNNVAARRSREARRLKENQIALRTAYLEKQNYGLKSALQDVNMKNEKLALEKKILMEKLQKYELMASAFLE